MNLDSGLYLVCVQRFVRIVGDHRQSPERVVMIAAFDVDKYCSVVDLSFGAKVYCCLPVKLTSSLPDFTMFEPIAGRLAGRLVDILIFIFALIVCRLNSVSNSNFNAKIQQASW